MIIVDKENFIPFIVLEKSENFEEKWRIVFK